jgi:hypothetical protein
MKVGRKLSFDPSKVDKILASIDKSNGSLGQVADLNDIPRDNFYNWMQLGEQDRKKGLCTELAQFSGNVKKKQAETILRIANDAFSNDKKTRFISWWLSKIAREDFGDEGIEIKELRELFKVILPLIGKGEIINAGKEEMDSRDAYEEGSTS